MRVRETFLFLTGREDDPGKEAFAQNLNRTKDRFAKLSSSVSRPPRKGEDPGVGIYFHDEKYFQTENFLTKYPVRETSDAQSWKSGGVKYMKGVPFWEFERSYPNHVVYDVAESDAPICQAISRLKTGGFSYRFEIIHFINCPSEIGNMRIPGNLDLSSFKEYSLGIKGAITDVKSVRDSKVIPIPQGMVMFSGDSVVSGEAVRRHWVMPEDNIEAQFMRGSQNYRRALERLAIEYMMQDKQKMAG